MTEQKNINTQMVKPPQETTKMVAKKTVKIEAIRTIAIGNTQLAPGEQIEVTEEQAEEFCKAYEGHYAFAGERGNHDAVRHQIARAKVVS